MKNLTKIWLTRLLSCLLLCTVTPSTHAADRFRFPASIDITGASYRLCSTANMQVYVFVDIGDVALYLANCQHKPFLDQGRLLYFHYNHGFSAGDFRKSGTVLLKRNLNAQDFAVLQESLVQFNQLYQPVHTGDSYQVGTNPDGQLELFLNGRYLGRSNSSALSRNYFQIWFGKEPFNQKVKTDLLP